MPALIAPLVAFALGVALAIRARHAAERYDDAQRRAALRVVALLAAFVMAPVTGYFVAFAGDWSLAYLADARSVPSALGLLWVVVSGVAMPLGFEAGLRAVRRRARGELVALAAAPAAMAFIFAVALYPELRLEGTTAGVRGGFGTHPVAGSLLGWGILWMDGMLVAGVTLTLRALLPRRMQEVALAPKKTLAPEAPGPSPATRPGEISPSADPDADARPPPRRLLGQRGRAPRVD